MEARAARIAMNDTVARTANSIVPVRRAGEAFTFLCECGRAGCRERVRLGRAEYERVRLHPRRSVVTRNHHAPGAERIVVRHDAYIVVEDVALRSVA
jgi:hypothetical protein